MKKLNRRQRETCSASDLVVGMQCGGSDAFSGLTGNPAAGFAADLIVRAGGTALFSEVTEVRDAIHLLVPRAINAEVAQKLNDVASGNKKVATDRLGLYNDLVLFNPGPLT